jgi:hypothetical protein
MFSSYAIPLILSLVANTASNPLQPLPGQRIVVPNKAAAPGPVPSPITSRTSQCVSRGGAAHIEWGIYVVNTTMPSNQGSGTWGGGLLDNINGKAGCAPTMWQAQVDSATPQGVGATFNTPDFCTVNDISNAINAASSENDQEQMDNQSQWVYCSGDTLNDLFDDTGAVLANIAEDIGAVAGLLSMFAK